MAIKQKNQTTVTQKIDIENREPRVNSEIDSRLTNFMSQNQKSTNYYTQLVKENPERAVRSLMLVKMIRHEDQMKFVSKQLPHVREWVQKQPGLMERLMEKIKNINPMYQEKAFVGEATRLKGRIDFKPPTPGASIST